MAEPLNNLTERISALSPARRALLEKTLKEKRRGLPPSETIARERDSGSAPLSFAQETFWFLAHLNREELNLCRPSAFRLKGSLDVAALEKSINGIISRHEILRTTFAVRDGLPLQVVNPHTPLALTGEDLGTLPVQKRKPRAVTIVSRDIRRPFDLFRGPLVRTKLFRMGEDDHILLLMVHHILFDGWSERVFLRELSDFYNAFSGGETPTLEELPLQYADYSRWQKRRLAGEGAGPLLSYWKQQLDGAAWLERAGSLPGLPTDKPLPAARAYRASQQSVTLPQGLSAALNDLSINEESTLFITLLAAFKTLLYRYTGQEDILVGSPAAGRNRVELERLIGFFVNTLALRTDVSGDPPFLELLRRVRKTALDAYAHQDMPFEKLAGELRSERRLSYEPLIRVMFSLKDFPGDMSEMKGLHVDAFPVEVETSLSDLALEIYPSDGGMRCVFSYSADLFEEGTVRRMTGHFLTLLEGIIKGPGRRLSELPLLTDAERDQILVRWNDTKKEYPLDHCIHHLIEAQAARTPESVAAVCEGRRLTYRELNGKANSLASALLAKGVGKGSYVPLIMGRSLDLLVSCMAVMKAGAAFSPLDAAWPSERIQDILGELKSSVVLVDKEAVPQEASPHRDFVVVDERELLPTALNPAVEVHADDPIYVIFTSGSTGRPKGAVNMQRGLTNRFFNTTDRYGSREDDAVLVLSSPAFDASVWLLLWPLIHGARTIIPRERPFFDIEYYIGLIEREEVTLTDVVPSLFGALLEYLTQNTAARGKLRTMRHLLVGGEAMNAEVVYRFKTLFPAIGVTNGYGPTETSIDAIFYDVPEAYVNPVPLGRPLFNIHTFILDRHMNPVPAGVAGELYIGGACVGMGYLNDEKATHAAFIENPFAQVDCPVLYRTGDLAKYLPDGNIVYLGRRDYQVKIRGVRIEPGEIEAVLSLHPAVRESVVVPRETHNGDKTLTAYLVLRGGQSAGPPDLRDFIRKKLPAIMVPSAFVFLDALPLTTAGKVDRDALPGPGDAHEEREHTEKAPRSRTEEIVRDTWAEVLGIERIGVYDNFFDIGGHSLAAARVAARLCDKCGIRLPLRDIFEAPTVSGLARLIDTVSPAAGRPHNVRSSSDDVVKEEREILTPLQFLTYLRGKNIRVWTEGDRLRYSMPHGTERPGLREELLRRKEEIIALLHKTEAAAPQKVPPRPVTRDRDLKLSFAQQRLWMLEQLRQSGNAYRIAAAFRLTGTLEDSVLQRSIDEIVRRHDILRTTFRQKNDTLVQIVAPQGNAEIRRLDLRALPKTMRDLEVGRLIDDGLRLPFDLEKGPLLRVALLHLEEKEYMLLFLFHHIIFDGWSREVFFKELSALYQSYSAGEPSPLPGLPLQYADFAAWQREWLQGQILESKLSYWREKLDKAPPVLELPADRPRSSGHPPLAARLRSEFSRPLTSAIRDLCMQEKATPFMVLLTALKTLFHRYTNQHDIVVGTPIAGRTRVEIEDLIGFFVNTLALRTDLSGNPTFLQLLTMVRETALGAYDHQELPFEKLVEELQPARNRGQNVFFSIFFNMTGGERRRLSLTGMSVEELPLPVFDAKFDLTFYAHDSGETIQLDLVYNAGLFNIERMSVLLDQLRYLLEQVVAAPGRPVRDYSLVTPSSRSILPDPQTALQELYYPLVTDMIAARASRDPRHHAICQGDQSLSYGEIVERSREIARGLIARGIRKGDVVAVSGRSSIGLITAMLGVFYGGGVLLILDPQLPQYRRQVMVAEAGARHILYVDAAPHEVGDAQYSECSSFTRIVQESGEILRHDGISHPADSGPLPILSPSDPAYIFFTSGTTGVPKGVLGSHKGLSHFLEWQSKTFGIGTSDRFAQTISLSFDAVLRDIFTPLISGATLCVPENHDVFSADPLTWLAKEKISVLHVVPSVAESWLSNPPAGTALNDVRLVFFAGEPLKDTLVRSWNTLLPTAHTIVNLYGPTETTLVKCFYVVPDEPSPGIQPLGRALPASQILVLGDDNRLCGIGEPGEIVIRTPFMTYGYVNAAEEKKARFVPNPFHEDADDTVYFSGDLGCYRPDGSLQYLGRRDDQLKVRGVRIEPCEIESVLSQHPLVRQAFVTAREDRKGETQLTAYLVVRSTLKGTVDDIRTFMRKMLPGFMVPAAFVCMDAFPLTSVGKIDRHALPAPDDTNLPGEEVYLAPRTETEVIVSAIWADVLGLDKIGIKSDFFQLGGHSLIATRVISRLSEMFMIKLSLRDIFEAPTICALSDLIETALKRTAAPCSPGGSAEDEMEEGRL